jgi:hypothetical protein
VRRVTAIAPRPVRSGPLSRAPGALVYTALVYAALVVGAFALQSCSQALPPGKYPAVDLGARSFELRVLDTRAGDSLAPAATDSAAEATLDVRFPISVFTSKAQERLAQLQSSSGVPLITLVNVKKAQMTLVQDVTGNLVRWEVQLGITVTTLTGAVLGRGTTSGWRELSERGASEADLREAFLSAAIGAFDEYFGSEQTLKSVKLELASFVRSHPQ